MNSFDWRNTIKPNIFVLRAVGLWPKDYGVYQFNSYMFYSAIATITIIGGHNLSQITNIYFVYSNLEELSGTIFIAATNLFAVIKRYYFIKKLRIIKQLLKKLNSYHFRPKNVEQENLVESSVKVWTKSYIGFSILVYSNVSLWCLVPILNNWVKEFKLPFEAWYPFNITKSPNYELVYLYQVICIWYITVANLNIDTFIYAFMMFISTQCQILADNLKHLKGGATFNRNLIKCIKHHTEILKFAKESNNFFNLIILGQIATSTAALALAMFQLTVIDASSGAVFGQVAYIFGMTSEIFLYCWFGNEVEVKSSAILCAIYEGNWIGESSMNLKNLLILCERCQKPIKITAIKLFTLSLTTFLNILRSAWSYFALLATVNKK